MIDERIIWLGRHSGVAFCGVNAVIFLVFALLAEITLRIVIPFNPGYYVAVAVD